MTLHRPETLTTDAAGPRADRFTLVSSPTCPFVQRAVIVLEERGTPYQTVYVDLEDKPAWFTAISPLGKVPLLKVGESGAERILFESAAILEFLEDTHPESPLHPADPVARAEHRAWIEVGSAALGDLWRVATATSGNDLDIAVHALRAKLARLEARIGAGPWFDGAAFSNVDAVFAPAFRSIAVLDSVTPTYLLDGFPNCAAWSDVLLGRPSVRAAAPSDYAERYIACLRRFHALILEAA
jgi:glutathione S-transferase